MRTSIGSYLIAGGLVLTLVTLTAPEQIAPAKDQARVAPDGRELFTREWLPGDKRSIAGDGLGPMFNDSSCVACHNLGGIGGGGPESKNILMVSVVAITDRFQVSSPFASGSAPGTGPTRQRGEAASRQAAEMRARLTKLHAGFATSRTTVLHRSSLDPTYAAWCSQTFLETFERVVSGAGDVNTTPQLQPPTQETQQQIENLRSGALAMQRMDAALGRAKFSPGGRERDGFQFVVSPRNTTALFGAGLIDSIATADILAGTKRPTVHQQVSGRVARLKNGKLGRFGWKAQQATLRDFTLAACAVELGLNVPGNAQHALPHRAEPIASGLDMDEEQCNALVNFVSNLKRPVEREGVGDETAMLAAGAKTFQTVGCADCHVAHLGPVSGLYSDLLLHDMGPLLADTGAYGSTLPNSSDESEEPLPLASASNTLDREPTADELAKTVGALRQEWRTPPLWGCRDSAPYLHDGRADSLEEAIALHHGEARASALRYFGLPDEERNQLLAFLKSLVAPGLE